jgi:hypothetical protein
MSIKYTFFTQKARGDGLGPFKETLKKPFILKNLPERLQ